jgi:hypothetical protein
MRFIGLDVHRDWCDVAIYENGSVRSCGRVPTAPDQLALSPRASCPTIASALRRRATR